MFVMLSEVYSERYHLCLLLFHVVSASSIEELRTYQHITNSTFNEAAMQYGLLLDDSEW